GTLSSLAASSAALASSHSLAMRACASWMPARAARSASPSAASALASARRTLASSGCRVEESSSSVLTAASGGTSRSFIGPWADAPRVARACGRFRGCPGVGCERRRSRAPRARRRMWAFTASTAGAARASLARSTARASSTDPEERRSMTRTATTLSQLSQMPRRAARTSAPWRDVPRPAPRGAAVALLAAAALVAPLVALPTSAGAQPTSCPTTIEEARFASAEELRALNAKIASFGLRNPGSAEHDRMLEWLVRELRAIPGMKVRSDFYTLTRWQPLPRAVGRTRLATSDATGDAGDDGQRALPRASALRRDLAE